jgi:hypothetical protein
MKRLPRRVDVERRRLLLMKRAERAIVGARALEWKVRAYHLDNVIRRRDLFDCVGWDRAHDFAREEGETLTD